VRSGPPKDDEADLGLDVWAGVVPLQTTAGKPESDPSLAPGVETPSYARNYRRDQALSKDRG